MRHPLINPLRWILICLGSLFLGSLTLRTAAQAPPLGSWDMVIGGGEHGVAQITFLPDGTLDGEAAFTFFGRNVHPATNAFTPTRVFGSARLLGSWAYDGRTNRITGFINEVAFTSGSGTNLTTNGLSFRAVVRPSRINVVSFGDQGRVLLRGVPLQATTNDISGTYHATVFKRGLPFTLVEVFDLAGVSPNYYTVTGGGPAYDYEGIFLLSRLRYAAFHQSRGSSGNELLITAYAGPFNAVTRRGSFRGTDGTNSNIRYKLSHEMP